MVTVHAQLTEKEFIKASFATIGSSPAGYIFKGIVVLFLFNALFSPFMGSSSTETIKILAPAALWFVIIPLGLYLAFKRTYNKIPTASEAITYTFTETSIEMAGQTFETRADWTMFRKVKVKKKWVLLMQNNFQALPMPRDAFGENELNGFLLYARQNGLKIKV